MRISLLYVDILMADKDALRRSFHMSSELSANQKTSIRAESVVYKMDPGSQTKQQMTVSMYVCVCMCVLKHMITQSY